MATKFITKNKKVIPLSITKLSDTQLEKMVNEGNAKLNEIERKHGETFILKNKKLDALAEKVALGRITQRNRMETASQKVRDEEDKKNKKNPNLIALAKLQKNPKFKVSADHTYGYMDAELPLPNYVEGVAFAQNPRDSNGNLHRFGIDGEGAFRFSLLGEDRLKEIVNDAKKAKLLEKFDTVRALISKSKVKVRTEADKPVIIILGKRRYLVAPVFRDA